MTSPDSIIVTLGKRTYVARRQIGYGLRYRAVVEIFTEDKTVAEAVAYALADKPVQAEIAQATEDNPANMIAPGITPRHPTAMKESV